MRVIKVVVLVVVLLILAVFALIYFLPDKAHMERQITINAPTYKVYQDLITFRNFNKWSPWALKAEDAQYSYTGPDFGVGAKLSWLSDNPDLGNGSMEILLVEKNKRVVWEMNFDGYQSSPKASFLLVPLSDTETKVVWTYDEEHIVGFSKIFMLGIDGFLGGDYELGLNLLKERVEGLPNFAFNITPELIPGFYYIGIQDSSLNEPSMMEVKMAADFGELNNYVNRYDLVVEGDPITMFISEGDFNVNFICGLPVMQIDTIYSDRLHLYHQDTVQALVGECTGTYDLETAHDDIEKFASYYDYEVIGLSWESYVTGYESEVESSQWLTEIYYPFQ